MWNLSLAPTFVRFCVVFKCVALNFGLQGWQCCGVVRTRIGKIQRSLRPAMDQGVAVPVGTMSGLHFASQQECGANAHWRRQCW